MFHVKLSKYVLNAESVWILYNKTLSRLPLLGPSLFYLLVHSRCRGFLWFHLITLRHTPQLVGLLWTRDRPVAETSTWQHKHCTRQTSTPPVGFEPTIPASAQPQTLRLRLRDHWDFNETARHKSISKSRGIDPYILLVGTKWRWSEARLSGFTPRQQPPHPPPPKPFNISKDPRWLSKPTRVFSVFGGGGGEWELRQFSRYTD
jgi:hypothetical protein